ncbi:MAG: class I SAM-dependent methyltransferase [Sulfobacillus sp.]
MKTILCQLAEKYCCDKTPSIRHSYTPFYHRLLTSKTVLRLLEIGVGAGASMWMWREYFPYAKIYGIDNDPAHIFQEGSIHTLLCDASNSVHLRGTVEKLGGNFDLIIDDGSHYPEQQISTFHTLRPFLASGGVYVVEDVLHFARVSDGIDFPHSIHRFGGCKDPSDDTLIVFGEL